jgi:hypothetical protein
VAPAAAASHLCKTPRRTIAETRRMRHLLLALLLAAAAPLSSFAQASGAGIAGARIADLAWLEGHWAGADGPLQMEEIWTSAAGGALVGLHKDVATTGTVARMVSFEFLRIERGDGGIAYVAQPGGRPATRFALAELGRRRAVFANPAHDFPQRIVYWLDEAGALHARIEGPKGGRTVGQEWTWARRAPR